MVKTWFPAIAVVLLLSACGGAAAPPPSQSPVSAAVPSASAPAAKPATSSASAKPAATSSVKVGAQELRTFTGHKNFVTSLLFDKSGATLISGSLDQEVKLWDVASGQLTKSLDHPGQAVNGLAASKDGKLLASAGGNIVVLWDAASGKQAIKPIKVQTNPTQVFAAFSSDGKILLTGTRDGLKAYNAATGQPITTAFPSPSGQITALAYSPDGSLVAAAAGGVVHVLDAASGQVKQRLTAGAKDVTSVAFSPEGKLLASAGHDGLKLWDVASGQEKTLVGDTKLASSSDLMALATIDTSGVAFSSDGKLLAAGGSSGLRLWDMTAGQPVKVPDSWGSMPPNGRAGALNAVAFSPDGKLLASGGMQDSIKLWQVGQ